MPVQHAAIFAAVFAALYTGHHIGDQWTQTHHQACGKGQPGWTGRSLCARHTMTLIATKLATLAITAVVLHLHLSAGHVAIALVIDGASHYWADRRTTLARLARAVGKSGYYQLGSPRPGHDDNPGTGTGAFHLDQAWHLAWTWAAALIIAAA
jgi:hypothetical protein